MMILKLKPLLLSENIRVQLVLQRLTDTYSAQLLGHAVQFDSDLPALLQTFQLGLIRRYAAQTLPAGLLQPRPYAFVTLSEMNDRLVNAGSCYQKGGCIGDQTVNADLMKLPVEPAWDAADARLWLQD